MRRPNGLDDHMVSETTLRWIRMIQAAPVVETAAPSLASVLVMAHLMCHRVPRGDGYRVALKMAAPHNWVEERERSERELRENRRADTWAELRLRVREDMWCPRLHGLGAEP